MTGSEADEGRRSAGSGGHDLGSDFGCGIVDAERLALPDEIAALALNAQEATSVAFAGGAAAIK